MQYKGIELVEMVPENWNGKTRKMIVWNPLDTRVSRETIIGYEEGADDTFCWIDHYGKYWKHCAEIPEESYITNNMTSDEIIERFKNLRTELKQWLRNNDASNLLVNNLQYGIKTALNLTHVNHHFIDAVDFSKIGEPLETTPCTEALSARIKELEAENVKLQEKLVSGFLCDKAYALFKNKLDENAQVIESMKKTRRMTNRELARWLYNENGEWTNASMRTAYQHFDYDVEREAEEVSEHIKIRACNEDTWHEPLIEE